MSEEKCCGGSASSNTNQEVIYTNDAYRVEKIGIKTDEDIVFIYGVYSNAFGVLEVETTILAKALNTADDLEKAVDTFYQSKAFEGDKKETESLIAKA